MWRFQCWELPNTDRQIDVVALRRTESDIDSDSDTPNVLSNTSNRKPAANSDVEDDFDFYG